METVEIVLIVIGVVFLIASCFVQERFAKKDIDALAKMSETELKMVIDKQLSSAKKRAGESIEEMLEQSLGTAQRGLEKETNKKIMAVSEYSDTILENMNKTHNEIMFLYSMLNDKHVELTQFANSLKQITSQKIVSASNVNMVSEELMAEPSGELFGSEAFANDVYIPDDEKNIEYRIPSELYNADLNNKNERILALHKSGSSDVEIAKELGCGLGEVRLVLGLFKEEQMNEA
uniref:DUF6115 domain-containing protein n=1 Tax=Agathobacter sp. TaxID=2021311 RepID=UPI0040560E4E